MVWILSWITYLIPDWEEQLTRQLQERLDAFVERARQFGIFDENYTTAELVDKADARFLGLYKDGDCGTCINGTNFTEIEQTTAGVQIKSQSLKIYKYILV